MSKKKKKIIPSIESANENTKENILSRMNHCEKCGRPLIEEIFFWDSSRKQFMKTNRAITCVFCNKT